VEYPGLPEVLYHYTDVAGVRGILESGELWATRTRCLNDTTEIEHGRRLAIEVADDLLPDMINQDPTLFIRQRLDGEKLTSWSVSEYLGVSAVVAFTESRDELLHWQSYGRRGAGVALAFDAGGLAALSSTKRMAVAPEFQLLKVRYDDAEKRDLLKEIYRYHDTEMTRLFANPECELDPLDECYGRAVTFCAALATFKGIEWRHENEWRLATSVLGPWESRGDEVEYVRLPVLLDGVVPVLEIIAGSQVPGDDADALGQLASERAGRSVEVGRSRVPLR